MSKESLCTGKTKAKALCAIKESGYYIQSPYSMGCTSKT